MRSLFSIIITIFFLFSSTITDANGAEKESLKTENMRALSLKVLQDKIEGCGAVDNCGDIISTLARITVIHGYVIDEKHDDVILFGEVDRDLPYLHLEDFVIALKNSWMKYAELKGNTYYYSAPGCSIDPDPKVLNRLQVVSNRIASNQNPKSVQTVLDEWRRVCRMPQKVRVLGIPFHSRFGKIMVEADYDMKRLVDGSVDVDISGFSSLSDMTMSIARNALQKGEPVSLASLNRFWFYPGQNSFEEDEGIAVIKESRVKLLTEEEFLTKEGDVAGSGKANPLAARFAHNLTTHYSEIAHKKPIYKELENLFRFVALAKLMKFKNAVSKAGMESDILLNRFTIKKTWVKPTLPGRSNVKDFKERTETANGYSEYYFWLPSCGGVSIDISIKNRQIVRDMSGRLKELRRRILSSRPSLASLYWDVFAPAKAEAMTVSVDRREPSSNSPITNYRYIDVHNMDNRWVWTFEENNKEYSAKNRDIPKLAIDAGGSGGGNNFIITRKGGASDDNNGKYRGGKMRNHYTGWFSRQLFFAGAGAYIATDKKAAEKKRDKLYNLPPMKVHGRNNVVLLKSLPGNKYRKINKAYKEVRNMSLADPDSLQTYQQGNLLIFVEPFTPKLMEKYNRMALEGMFKNKVVLFIVCGPKGRLQGEAFYQYLDVINRMIDNGATMVVGFENRLSESDGEQLIRGIDESISKSPDSNIEEVLRAIFDDMLREKKVMFHVKKEKRYGNA